jgi:hypothetical protein
VEGYQEAMMARALLDIVIAALAAVWVAEILWFSVRLLRPAAKSGRSRLGL